MSVLLKEQAQLNCCSSVMVVHPLNMALTTREVHALVEMICMVSTEYKINLVENRGKLHLFGAN